MIANGCSVARRRCAPQARPTLLAFSESTRDRDRVRSFFDRPEQAAPRCTLIWPLPHGGATTASILAACECRAFAVRRWPVEPACRSATRPMRANARVRVDSRENRRPNRRCRELCDVEGSGAASQRRRRLPHNYSRLRCVPPCRVVLFGAVPPGPSLAARVMAHRWCTCLLTVAHRSARPHARARCEIDGTSRPRDAGSLCSTPCIHVLQRPPSESELTTATPNTTPRSAASSRQPDGRSPAASGTLSRQGGRAKPVRCHLAFQCSHREEHTAAQPVAGSTSERPPASARYLPRKSRSSCSRSPDSRAPSHQDKTHT